MTSESHDDDNLLETIKSETDDVEIETGPLFKIVNYGADYTLSVIAETLTKGDIVIPSFQRRYVWNITKASKLVESFLMGLPIPQIFLYKEMETEKLLVVDGQQRLKTIQMFFDEKFIDGKDFVLRYVNSRWEGKKFSDLSESEKRRFEGSILRATIFQQTDSNDNRSIFEVFERLNTGGTLLNSQEIRNCVIQGKINKYLDSLNKHKTWRILIGKDKTDSRMRDIEMILRFLALYNKSDEYYKPMKEFLTNFMREKKNLSENEREKYSKIFTKTMDYIYDTLGKDAFKIRTGVNIAVMDAVSVSIAMLGAKPIPNIKEKYKKLIEKDEFEEMVSVHTTDKDKVLGRIKMAIEAFSR